MTFGKLKNFKGFFPRAAKNSGGNVLSNVLVTKYVLTITILMIRKL